MTPTAPRLAGTAYATMTRMLEGYTAAERLDLGAQVWAYRFTSSLRQVYVVWGEEGATVSLPMTEHPVSATDTTGTLSSVDPGSLALGPSPVYVTAR